MEKIIATLTAIVIFSGLAIALVLCIAAPITMLSGNIISDENTAVEILLAFAFMAYVLLTIDDGMRVARNIDRLNGPGIVAFTSICILFIVCLIGFIINL